ncbi:glycosyltransferase family 1 protein [Pantoea sp.]|uniref:glycosyltransferase family 4 protein n=1 Tax=Pantoea sp. TaxID=69393 RepID=UPI0031E3B864
MKVIISSDPIKFPLTGIGRYTYELIMAFQKLKSFEDVKYLNGYTVVNDFNSNHGVASVNSSSSLKTRIVSQLKKSSVADVYRVLSPYLKSRALSSYTDHIFHGTNFYVPKFKGKSISTFHDLSPFLMPHCIEPKRCDFLQRQLTETVKNATFFITDTHHTKNELIEHFGIDENRVKAVHLACDSSFQVRKEAQVLDALHKYGLSYNNFSLCVCTIEPRKNIDVLIDAYSRLPNVLRAKFPLVLVGHEGWCSEKTHVKIKRFESEGWLKYLSFVNHDDLPLIYSAARLFVFPSIYEGFGLPILEAMSSGVPVISSNASCLPEVAGEAALYFAPSDVEGLSSHLNEMLEDEETLDFYRQSGLKRVEQFSWHRCAMETLQVYKTLSEL